MHAAVFDRHGAAFASRHLFTTNRPGAEFPFRGTAGAQLFRPGAYPGIMCRRVRSCRRKPVAGDSRLSAPGDAPGYVNFILRNVCRQEVKMPECCLNNSGIFFTYLLTYFLCFPPAASRQHTGGQVGPQSKNSPVSPFRRRKRNFDFQARS